MGAPADSDIQTNRRPTGGRPLSGRTAIVTGSTSGIGLAIAQSLAAAGADIVLNGFGPPDEIARTQHALASDHAVRVVYSNADMSDAASIAHMIGMVEDELGGTDILVNNAGIQHVAPVVDFPPEKWNAILAINLTSAFHTTRLTLPAMQIAPQPAARSRSKHLPNSPRPTSAPG